MKGVDHATRWLRECSEQGTSVFYSLPPSRVGRGPGLEAEKPRDNRRSCHASTRFATRTSLHAPSPPSANPTASEPLLAPPLCVRHGGGHVSCPDHIRMRMCSESKASKCAPLQAQAQGGAREVYLEILPC